MKKTLILIAAIASIGLGAMPARAESEKSFNNKIMASWVHFARLEYTAAVDTLDSIKKPTEKQQKIKAVLLLAVLRNSGNIAAQGRPDDAIQMLSRAIRIKDDHAHTRRRRGQAYCMTGMIAECEADFDYAWTIETNRDAVSAGHHLAMHGSARQMAGDIDGAKEAFDRAAHFFEASGETSMAEIYSELAD